MKKIDVNTKHTLDEYKIKCKSHAYRLLKFSKKEVEDYDVKHKPVFDKFLLRGRSWWLIDDTYYEVPKAPRATWFSNLSKGAKVATCCLLTGVVAGGAGYGIYYAISSLKLSVQVSSEEVKVEGGVQEDGSVKVNVVSKVDKRVVDSVVVKIGDKVLDESEYTYDDVTGDIKVPAEVIKKYGASKVIVEPQVVDGIVTTGQMKNKCNNFINYENRNFKYTSIPGDSSSNAGPKSTYDVYNGNVKDTTEERDTPDYEFRVNGVGIYAGYSGGTSEEKELEVTRIFDDEQESMLLSGGKAVGLTAYEKISELQKINNSYHKENNKYVFNDIKLVDYGSKEEYEVKVNVEFDNDKNISKAELYKKDERKGEYSSTPFETQLFSDYNKISKDFPKLEDIYNVHYVDETDGTWNLTNIDAPKNNGQQLCFILKRQNNAKNIDFSKENYVFSILKSDTNDPIKLEQFRNCGKRNGSLISEKMFSQSDNGGFFRIINSDSFKSDDSIVIHTTLKSELYSKVILSLKPWEGNVLLCSNPETQNYEYKFEDKNGSFTGEKTLDISYLDEKFYNTLELYNGTEPISFTDGMITKFIDNNNENINYTISGESNNKIAFDCPNGISHLTLNLTDTYQNFIAIAKYE